MNSSILYLTYDGLTDPLGQSQILPYLNGLAEKGHDITVVSFEKLSDFKTFSFDGAYEEQNSELGAQGSKLARKQYKLKVVALKYHKSPPVLSTLYDLYLLKREVKKILESQHIDIIHCRSYITSLIGLWAKRKYGVKFIFDMRGFWADERVEGKIWSLKNPIFRWVYNYFKKKESQFISKADAVVSLTENAKKEILNWKIKDINQDKISVIPTCVDLNHFNPETIEEGKTMELRKSLGINASDFVLLYLGSLGTWYMVDEMLDFYEELKAQSSKLKGAKNFKFLFVTKDQEVLHKALMKRDYHENEIIVTSAARKDVPQHIALASASIFFIIPTYSKKASSATKMGEIMAMGKPVITNSGWGDVEELITQENGIIIRDFQKEAYKKSILELKELVRSNPLEIRKTAEKFFSLENGVAVYHDIYLSLGKIPK